MLQAARPDLAVRPKLGDEDGGCEVFSPSEAPAAGFAALCGRLDNHGELSGTLVGRDLRSPKATGAGLLWGLYRASGAGAFHGLKGVFSAVVADYGAHRIHLFRSHLLGRSLYYFLSDSWLVVASDTQGVLRHPAVANDLDDAWLASFFNFRAPSNASTPFRAVRELLPGELLTVTRDNQDSSRKPSTIGQLRIRFTRDEDYVERFDELVSRSVARQAKGRRDIGVMLSGGLDSVPAAWWLHHHQEPEGRLAAYSWSLSRFPESDETGLIRQSAAMIGIPAHVTKGDELWPLCAPNELPLCPDTPQQNAYRPLKQAVYRMAADHGCRFIFNGHYGDRLYPEYHHVLAEALNCGNVGRFARELKFLAQAEGFKGLYRHSAFRQIAKKALGWRRRPRVPDNALTPFANGLIDWERNWPPEAQDHPRPDQYRALLGANAARGLDGENYFAGLYGLELVELYVDQDLIDFVLSVPAYFFWNLGETKVLMRQAMKGRIPESVRTRPRGGLLNSFYYHGMDQRVDWIKQRLFGGESDWPRFADRGRVRDILDSAHPDDLERMLVMQCVYYEMWLDRYFR